MFEYMSSEMLRQNVEPACVEVKKCGNTFLTNVFHRNMCGAPTTSESSKNSPSKFITMRN